MWNSKGFGDQGGGGGGFYNNTTSNEYPSPSQNQGEKKVRRAQNVVPVTARQVLESPEKGLKIGSEDINVVTLVGVVKTINTDSMKTVYFLEDDTGTIGVYDWMEKDAGMEEAEVPIVMENSYYRVYGSVRTVQGKAHITLFKIMPITDLNELTSHLLEVTYCNMKAEALSKMEIDNQNNTTHNMPTNNMFLSNSMMSSDAGDSVDGLTEKQRIIYNFIKANSHEECGVMKNRIVDVCSARVSKAELDDAITFLINEGHIYTTIDDLHYRATDY